MSTLVSFDLDGTLEDSRKDMIASVHRVRDAMGLKAIEDDDVRPHLTQGLTHLYEKCFDDALKGAGPGKKAFEDVRKKYEADYLAHIADKTRLYEGVSYALADLAKFTRLVCVTNKPEAHTRALLEALKIAGRFSAVVGGDTLDGVLKPDPKMLAAACEPLGVNPKSDVVVHVGDTLGDIKMAKAFGARSVWVAWGYTKDAPDDPAADFVADDGYGLSAVVEQALAG